MIEIVPAIIADSYEELEEQIRAVEPYVNRVHIDIMDGIFVPHKTIDGPAEIERLETKLELEIHLMVQKPENHIVRWLETRADKFLAHAESTSQFRKVIDFVRESDPTKSSQGEFHGASRSIFAVLNPETSCDVLKDYVSELDGVQFMTVHPGKQGAEFVEDMVKKIEDFLFYYPDMVIETDGAMNLKTIPQCAAAGVSIFAVGSHIWDSKDIGKAIEELSVM